MLVYASLLIFYFTNHLAFLCVCFEFLQVVRRLRPGGDVGRALRPNGKLKTRLHSALA